MSKICQQIFLVHMFRIVTCKYLSYNRLLAISETKILDIDTKEVIDELKVVIIQL